MWSRQLELFLLNIRGTIELPHLEEWETRMQQCAIMIKWTPFIMSKEGRQKCNLFNENWHFLELITGVAMHMHQLMFIRYLICYKSSALWEIIVYSCIYVYLCLNCSLCCNSTRTYRLWEEQVRHTQCNVSLWVIFNTSHIQSWSTEINRLEIFKSIGLNGPAIWLG